MIQLFCLFSKCFGENEIQLLEVSTMRRRKRRTFEELVLENKKELLSNEEFLNQLEEKLEERFRQK
ncbi:Fur-regulated basic protein B [Bacillus pumilus]